MRIDPPPVLLLFTRSLCRTFKPRLSCLRLSGERRNPERARRWRKRRRPGGQPSASNLHREEGVARVPECSRVGIRGVTTAVVHQEVVMLFEVSAGNAWSVMVEE